MDDHFNVNDMNDCKKVFCATRDDKAPIFSTKAIVNNGIVEVNLDDYKGKWVLLFFYPSDFTFV